jgi:hypothetical protein
MDEGQTAWDARQDGAEMLRLLSQMSGPPGSESRRPLVLAACRCARISLPYARKGEKRPLAAIEAAERWALRKGAPLQHVAAASQAAKATAAVERARASARAAVSACEPQPEAAFYVAIAAAYAAAAVGANAPPPAHAVGMKDPNHPGAAAYAAAPAYAAADSAAYAVSNAIVASVPAASPELADVASAAAHAARVRVLAMCADIVRRHFPEPPAVA